MGLQRRMAAHSWGKKYYMLVKCYGSLRKELKNYREGQRTYKQSQILNINIRINLNYLLCVQIENTQYRVAIFERKLQARYFQVHGLVWYDRNFQDDLKGTQRLNFIIRCFLQILRDAAIAEKWIGQSYGLTIHIAGFQPPPPPCWRMFNTAHRAFPASSDRTARIG